MPSGHEVKKLADGLLPVAHDVSRVGVKIEDRRVFSGIEKADRGGRVGMRYHAKKTGLGPGLPGASNQGFDVEARLIGRDRYR